MRYTLRSLLSRWLRRSALPYHTPTVENRQEISLASRPRLLLLEDKSVPSGTATGFVFNDANFNGVFDSVAKGGSETGVGSVTVTAYDKFNAPQGTTSTALDGSYSLPLGGTGPYRLEFTNVPSGFVYGVRGSDSQSPVQFVAEGGSSNLSLALNDTTKTSSTTPIEIGDRVFVDLDNDGVQDANELGLQGVQVQLVDIFGNVLGTATTDTTGYFAFTNATGAGSASFVTNMALTQGGLFELRVQLGQANLAGFTSSPPKFNSGADSNLRDSDGLPDVGNTFVFAPFVPAVNGESQPNLDFGFSGSVAQGSIGDFVWFDANQNGIQDTGEVGLPNVTINLYDSANNFITSTTPNSVGQYSFTGLAPGQYIVEFVPTSAFFTITTAGQGGDPTLDSDANALTGRTAVITLGAGENNKDIDLGLVKLSSGLIGDFVWSDDNCNGIQDVGEKGLAGVNVTLLDSGGKFVFSTITDANGKYLFTNLPAGNYQVQFTAPAGFTISPQNQGANATLDSDADPASGLTALVAVAVGGGSTDVDAGMCPPMLASIGDYVWFDVNQNGIQDPTEFGVPNQTVNLYDGSGKFLATQLTGANGQYLFDKLAAGSYVVEVVTQPAGWSFTAKNQGADPKLDSDLDPLTGRTSAITLLSGQANLDIDAGLIKVVSVVLGDFVWNDLDCDGIQDPGEPGFAGVKVSLLDSTNAVVATQLTDANGKYLFTGFAPGTYSVQFDLPAGFTFSPMSVGGNSALDSDVDPLTGRTAQVTLVAGQTNFDLDAGLCAPMLSAIGDYVWFDFNQNGIQDPSEFGVANQTVNLYDGSGKLLATQVTDINGMYLFSKLQAGTYIVEVVTQPAGWAFTAKNQGADPKLDSDVSPLTGRTSVITLAAGETNLDVDAGLIKVVSVILGDFVWNDIDCDGIQDPGEPGFAGVKVSLVDSTNTVIASQLTDVNGKYLFTGFAPGTYSVQFDLPMGFVFSPQGVGGNPALDSDVDPLTGRTPTVTLLAGQSNLDLDAGLCIPMPMKVKLGDFVWVDTDCDGLQDPGEPGVQGITVKLLDGTGKVIGTTTTDLNGKYLFDNLDPGSYQVQWVLPTGFAFTKANVGANPALNSDATVGTGISSPVTLTNADNLDIDAGLVVLKEISGFVYEDVNDNGVFDPGENPIPGAIIRLAGTDDLGNPVFMAGKTDATGKYSFLNIRPGTYNITETQPIGYLDGKDTLGTPFPGVVGDDQFTSVMIDCDLNNKAGANYNFGELRPTSIRGNVYWDRNDNGILDPNEPGIPSVEVTLVGLDNRGNQVIRTITTGARGSYLFTGLRPGTYALTELQPPDWLPGRTPAVAGSSGGLLAPDNIFSIGLGYAINAFDYNFGEILRGENNPGKEDLLASSKGARVPILQDTIIRTGTTPTFANAVAQTRLGDPNEFRFVVVGGGEGASPLIRVLDYGSGVVRYEIMAYDAGFLGGVRVATGDVTGDGVPDIITAAGIGGGPHIKVFDGSTGTLVAQFFAYDAGFTGGVYVATGDVDADGVDEIITGAGEGGGPHVRVFNAAGNLIQQWFAYAAQFTGGVRVAAGDVNGDGSEEVITAAGPGGGPHVRVFNVLPLGLLGEFFAYDPSFVGGVYVAAGDTDNDGLAEIITGAGAGGGPHVRVFGGPSAGFAEYFGFFAYPDGFTGGVRVGAQDINDDGFVDLLITSGSGISTFSQVIDVTRTSSMDMFLAFDPARTTGAFIAG